MHFLVCTQAPWCDPVSWPHLCPPHFCVQAHKAALTGIRAFPATPLCSHPHLGTLLSYCIFSRLGPATSFQGSLVTWKSPRGQQGAGVIAVYREDNRVQEDSCMQRPVGYRGQCGARQQVNPVPSKGEVLGKATPRRLGPIPASSSPSSFSCWEGAAS